MRRSTPPHGPHIRMINIHLTLFTTNAVSTQTKCAVFFLTQREDYKSLPAPCGTLVVQTLIDAGGNIIITAIICKGQTPTDLFRGKINDHESPE